MSVATTNGADEDTPKRKRIRTRKTKPRTRDISTDKDDISLQNGDEIVKDEDGRADATNDGVSVGQKSVSKEDKEGKSKRKRKRTRNKGGKEDQDLEATGQTEAASTKNDQEFISGLKSLVLSHGDHALDERTSNALLYSRQYFLDRTNWKFNKAKQEYLIRHMLNVPPQISISASQSNSTDGNAKSEADESKDKDEIVASQPFFPEEWVECIARYLNTIQGQAKQRVIDTLNIKAQQEIPSQPVTATTAIDLATKPTSSSNGEIKKSVSFGDLAMKQDDSPGATQLSDQERHRLQFEKERAIKLLSFISM